MTDHKVKADEAVAEAARQGQEVGKVLVCGAPGQYASKTSIAQGRHLFFYELLARPGGAAAAPVSLPAEAPLFLMYTSGTTGRPKGAQHSTGGDLSYVAGTSKNYLDIHPGDVYWCMADIGWITEHSYIVYGPLALGTTTVIYEGVPNYPDGGVAVADRRAARGEHLPDPHPPPSGCSGRRAPGSRRSTPTGSSPMTTVGEPIEPEVWRWYHSEVGKGEAVITDTWWMTETGGFLGGTCRPSSR